tara:strand:+ start:5773 stop:5991 length:219 start_codon:yes stop_codon:yes gene_type:complete
MDISLENITDYDDFDIIKKTKMILIFNALEKGWKIKKNNNAYIFSKNHEGKKEVLLDNYIKRFIETNLKTNN